MKRELPIRFKGQRHYLHSTDIYDALIHLLEADFQLRRLQSLNMKLPRFLRHLPEAEVKIGPEGLVGHSRTGVEFWGQSDRGPFSVLLHDTDRELIARYDFEEERLRPLASIEDSSIVLCGSCGFSPIEYVVLLTKFLHQHQFAKDDGLWVVSALKLGSPLTAAHMQGLRVALGHTVGGQFTCSHIFSDGLELGQIFFAKVAAP